MVAQLPPLNQYRRRLYSQSPDKTKVICKTCKAASTFIRAHTHNWQTVTEDYATEHSKAGKRTILFFRDPISRFVSGFEFFRRGNVVAGFVRDEKDRLAITDKATDIETWFELIKRWPNEHWLPQIELHTHEDYFIPNEIYPVESLRYLGAPAINSSPGRQETEYYFRDNPDFKSRLEEYFAQDIELYRKVLEEWTDGTGPRNVF